MYVCYAVSAAPRSCEESAGELGRCDMVSAGLLSPDGKERQLWWLLQSVELGPLPTSSRSCSRCAPPPLGCVCEEHRAPQGRTAFRAVPSLTSRGFGAVSGVWLLNSRSRGALSYLHI